MLGPFVSPDLDIHRVELVFEYVMKTDQPKVLTTLLGVSNSYVGTVNELRAIIEKMDQPFRGLEILMDRISPSIDMNKISTVLNIIPTINRRDALRMLCSKTDTVENSYKFSIFDLRSVLMIMETSMMVDALRLVLNRYEPSSERDFDTIMECFSEANKPVVDLILQQKFGKQPDNLKRSNSEIMSEYLV